MPQKKPKTKKGRLEVKNDAVTVVQPKVEAGSIHSSKIYPPVDGNGRSEITQPELEQLGMREHTFIVSDKPHTIKKEGLFNEMEFRTVVETKNLRQPYLLENEVIKLGLKHWWPYRDGEFTTIVGGQRFKLTPSNFEDMKNKGLVIGCSLNEAPRYRS